MYCWCVCASSDGENGLVHMTIPPKDHRGNVGMVAESGSGHAFSQNTFHSTLLTVILETPLKRGGWA